MILTELITLIKATGIAVEAFSTNTVTNVCVYTYSNLTSDTVVSQDRLDITVIDTNLKTAYNNLKKIQTKLLTTGDTQLTQDIISVVHNGGSTPVYNYETKTYHIKISLIIKGKVR